MSGVLERKGRGLVMRVYELEFLGLVFLDHGAEDHLTMADSWGTRTQECGEIPRESFEDLRLGYPELIEVEQ